MMTPRSSSSNYPSRGTYMISFKCTNLWKHTSHVSKILASAEAEGLLCVPYCSWDYK
jgi:hypothetical protein